jgi:hypothetical protein
VAIHRRTASDLRKSLVDYNPRRGGWHDTSAGRPVSAVFCAQRTTREATGKMIVLFTDFGLHGPYAGQMKAVLHQMVPGTSIIDLFADAPVGNP